MRKTGDPHVLATLLFLSLLLLLFGVLLLAGQLASQHLRVPDKLPGNMLQLK